MKFGIREMIFLAVLLAMPISSYWFVFKPQNAEIAQAKKEIEHKEQMLEKLAEATRQTADLERANNEIEASINMIENRLPSQQEVDVILRQVSELATSKGLSIPQIRAQELIRGTRSSERPLEMTIEGNFKRFYAFLLELEKLERITRMPDLQLKQAREQDGWMAAKFTLSIYFEPSTIAEAKP